MLRLVVAGLGVSLVAVATAVAQVALPPLPGGGLPDLPGQPGLPADPAGAREIRVSTPRLVAIRQLIDSHPESIDADPRGAPIVRGEVLAISPVPGSLDTALAAGFLIARETVLEGLDLHIVTLTVPQGMSARRAIRTLRRLDPAGVYDFNHLYTGAGNGAAEPAPRLSRPAAHDAPAEGALKIGLVDAGVDAAHPVFAQARIRPWGCDGKPVSSPHGTAVASLLVGRTSGFAGVLPSAALYAADVYCGLPTGGNVLTLATALAWLASEEVRVINISLVGPQDATLERVVSRLVERGVLLVAAVGNDGPTAPPLYPAAYPGVVGVTGVDARNRVLIEAGRGPHVSFAAPGADMAAAREGGGYMAVRGTSFAAPLVAGLLVSELSAAGPRLARSRLATTAVDLGRRGRDDTYGAGLVGAQYRVMPDAIESGATPSP